jgi:hypothetical protein
MAAMEVIERLRPGSSTVHFNLGVLQAYYGDPQRATSRLEKALELLESDPDQQQLPEQRDKIRRGATEELQRLRRKD